MPGISFRPLRRRPPSRPFAARQRAFTLIELVTVMIIIAVLAVVALPRLGNDALAERGFHDAAKATLQHARHVAIAARRYVCVTTTAGSGAAAMLTLAIDTTLPEAGTAVVDCAAPLALPAPGKSCTPVVASRLCAPAGVALAGDSVIFDPRGIAVTAAKAPAAALALGINGDAALSIAIAAETGWIQ